MRKSREKRSEAALLGGGRPHEVPLSAVVICVEQCPCGCGAEVEVAVIVGLN
jgi:hypothetical protein